MTTRVRKQHKPGRITFVGSGPGDPGQRPFGRDQVPADALPQLLAGRPTEGDDQQDPIADSARAILDGHIVLSRRLAEAGHYPAIDIEASISRAMTALITEKHYARVRNFKQLLSSFQRNRDLVSVGAYAKGSDPMLDKAISLWPQLEAFLQQGIFERADWEDSIQALELIFPQV